jgi:hypothetical protein
MFCIGPNETVRLRAAFELARANPVSIDKVKATAAAVIDQNGNRVTLAERRVMEASADNTIAPERQSVDLPFGYRASMTFEQQPARLCFHLSLAGPEPGKVPTQPAVAMVFEALGVDTSISRVWTEEYEPGRFAISVIALMEPARRVVATS